MSSEWLKIPLWAVVTEVRKVVEPSVLGAEVMHYSIPSVDETGGGLVEPSEDIKSAKLRLAGGEILISKLNPRKSRVVHVAQNDLPIVASTEFVALNPNRSLDLRFTGYLLQTETVRQRLDSMVQSVTRSHQRVSPEDITHQLVALPPVSEQRRIADFLDAETARIDALTEVHDRAATILKERREAGVNAWVTGAEHRDRRLSDLAWVDTLPRTWQEVRVGLVARMGSGHTPSRSHPEWWTDCVIPWITTGEVSQVRDDRRETIIETRERISELGLANSAAELRPAGTVVLCRTASAGYSAVMGTDMATSQDFVTWTCGPRLNPYYLLWCLRAMRQDLLGRLAMGSTHKTIYVPDLQMLRIPLPDVTVQYRIVERIREGNDRIDRLMDALRRQVALLAERRQALITAAVTGQIDVTTARGVEVG